MPRMRPTHTPLITSHINMNPIIHIPRTLANKLLTLALNSPESGICGLIALNSAEQYQIYPIKITSDYENYAFNMHPQQLLAAIQQITENQQSLFAIYQSQSHAPSSRGSLASIGKNIQALIHNELANISISLDKEGVIEMQAYLYKQDHTKTADITILD